MMRRSSTVRSAVANIRLNKSDRMAICVRKISSAKVDGVASIASEVDPQSSDGALPAAVSDGVPGFSRRETAREPSRGGYAKGIGEAIRHLVSLGHERMVLSAVH